MNHLPIRTGAVLLLALSSLGARAGLVEVPLTVDARFVQSAVAEVLEIGADGSGQIRSDECNRIELDDLQVRPAINGQVNHQAHLQANDQVNHQANSQADHLVVSMAIQAVTGARVLGRCRGPSPWQGRMNLELVPGVQAGGLAVNFRPRGAELVRPDGTPGLLAAPTRMLAENLILPRLGRVEVDLASSLEAIDGLLESMLGEQTPGLVERTRIRQVRVVEAGLGVDLGFRVAPRPVPAFDANVAEPALDPEELVRWQRLEDELDGFLTTVITALVLPAESRELRAELLAALLDARHAIAEALSDEPGDDQEPESDPVRRILMDTWDRLRPWLAELDLGDVAGLEADLRLAAFIAGGDALRALDALGPEFGLEISRDGLRRLARLLLAEEAPERFTPLGLEVDPDFRALFALDRPPPAETRGLLLALVEWFVPSAHARSVSPADALRGLVPRLAILDDYLALVASLLEEQTGEHLKGGTRVPARLKPRFDPLVRATAWKESCWRQFTGPVDNPTVLTSSGGALGMMQINGRVWRGVYDLDRLADEVDYNVNAGTEILEHYLVDYAIRRGEHEHPGGDDNLIKATYAAYNGGPSHLSRYRRDDTPGRLRAIDNEFWRHYTTIKAEQWPDISSCYSVGP